MSFRKSDGKKPYRPGARGGKKPFGKKAYGKRDGDERPRFEDKPARKFGEKKPYGERSGSGDFKKRDFKKPYTARNSDERPRQRFDDNKPYGERKSFGDKKLYRSREDGDRPKPRFNSDRPYGERKSFGDKKPYRNRDEGDRKPYASRGSDERPRRPYARDGEDKPFRKSYGEKKPYASRSSDDRPRKRFDDNRPYSERKSFGDKKPYRSRDEGDRKPYGERKPYASRDGGDKPFRKSYGDKKPYESRGGDERQRKSFARGEGKASAFPGMRVAKVVARAGIGSRRDVEAAILDGRVTVNGKKITSPALNVTQQDYITLDGKPLPEAERTRLWLYHKPKDLVTTERDPEGRPTVFDNLPDNLPRVMSIGRLDINTEGLLLLTNDGGLKRALELPATGWLRRYRVRVFGKVKKEELDALSEGVTVDGVEYGPVEAMIERVTGDNTWLTIGIREGKNREIKNIAEHLGLVVSRLIRVSFGPFQLRAMEPSEVYEISPRIMKEQLGDEIIKNANLDFSSDRLASPRERQRLEKRKLREREEGSATGKAARYAALQSGDAPRRIRRDRETHEFTLEPKTVSDRKGRRVEVSGKPRKNRFGKGGDKPFRGKGRRTRPFKK